jgi:rhodanese-related sulfurtransferase
MEVTRVTVDEIRERLDRGEPLAFVDTRNAKDWGESDKTAAGAIRVPSDKLLDHLSEIPRDRTVITYCDCNYEMSSARVAQRLLEQGWKNVHPLHGGFAAWEKAGLPVDPKPADAKSADAP